MEEEKKEEKQLPLILSINDVPTWINYECLDTRITIPSKYTSYNKDIGWYSTPDGSERSRFLTDIILGRGAYGYVIIVCMDEEKQCKHALKIQVIDRYPENKTREWFQFFKREIKIMRIVPGGAKFIEGKICSARTSEKEKLAGLILMDRWDTTLMSIKEECLRNYDLVEKLIGQVEFLHSRGYVHGDLKYGNILVKLDADGYATDATIADFGLVQKVQEWQKVPELIDSMWNHLIMSQPREYTRHAQNLARLATHKMLLEDPAYLDTLFVQSMQDCLVFSDLPEFEPEPEPEPIKKERKRKRKKERKGEGEV